MRSVPTVDLQYSKSEKTNGKMSQPIPAETVGAVAERTGTSQNDATDTLGKVLTNMTTLLADPTRDQSLLGGAGSGQDVKRDRYRVLSTPK